MGSVPMLRRRESDCRDGTVSAALPRHRALLWRADRSGPTRARDAARVALLGTRRCVRGSAILHPAMYRPAVTGQTPVDRNVSRSGPAGKAAPGSLQVRLLQQALVLVRHQVGLDL